MIDFLTFLTSLYLQKDKKQFTCRNNLYIVALTLVYNKNQTSKKIIKNILFIF